MPQLGHSFDSLIEFALALNKQRQIDQARGLLDYAAIKIDTLKNSDDADYRLSDLADAWAECGEPEKALRASLHLTNRRLQIGCLTRTAISAVVANRGHTLAESFFRLLVLEDVEFKPLARSGLAQLAATQGMSDLAVEILMSCSGVDPRGVIDALVAHDQWELALSLPNLLGLDTSDDNTSLALVRNHAERGRYQLATLTAEELKGDILRLKALLLAAEVILERGDAEESAKILNRAKCAGASIPMSSELETVLADYLTPLGRPSPISSQLVTPDFLDANYEIVQMLVPPERNRGATEHYRLAALALLIRKSVELHDRGRAERFLDEAETVAMLTGITNMCNIAALCYEIGQFEASDRLLERILRSATDANDERLNRIAAIMSGFGLQFENCSSARMTCEALLSGSTTSP